MAKQRKDPAATAAARKKMMGSVYDSTSGMDSSMVATLNSDMGRRAKVKAATAPGNPVGNFFSRLFGGKKSK